MARQHRTRSTDPRNARERTGDPSDGHSGAGSGDERPAVALSEREFSVLSLIAQGLSDKEIAIRLSISGSTVHKHVGRILEKLEVSSRTEAAVRAVREGMI